MHDICSERLIQIDPNGRQSAVIATAAEDGPPGPGPPDLAVGGIGYTTHWHSVESRSEVNKMHDNKDKSSHVDESAGSPNHVYTSDGNSTSGAPQDGTAAGSRARTNAENGNTPYVAWYGESHDDSKNLHRFYSVVVNGTTVTRTYGRVSGYSLDWSREPLIVEYDSEAEAISAALEIVLTKARRGYSMREVEV